ncbi:hypothetical protein JCM14036_22320 [Desulfotomaculum defluvii]
MLFPNLIVHAEWITTGYCYQRLTKGDTTDMGYCIHALNAVYLKTLERWIRLDFIYEYCNN